MVDTSIHEGMLAGEVADRRRIPETLVTGAVFAGVGALLLFLLQYVA